MTTAIETDDNQELSKLIYFISDLKIVDKTLHVQMSSNLDRKVLQNKTINFDVVIRHLNSGGILEILFTGLPFWLPPEIAAGRHRFPAVTETRGL